MDDGNRLVGIDASIQKAEALFYQGSFQRCYELSSKYAIYPLHFGENAINAIQID